jgi:hypothetical protein
MSMRCAFLVSLTLTLTLLLLTCSRANAAQERDDPLASQALCDVEQATSPEQALLPAPLTDQQVRGLQPLPPVVPLFESLAGHRRPGFFRGAYNRPLTPREVALRDTIYKLAGRRNQFVHVRLADGKALTGTIRLAGNEAFLLETDILGNSRSIHYRQLAEPPQPVLAVGTRAVRGLETTGLVALCIIAIPVALALYPLIAAGVIKD